MNLNYRRGVVTKTNVDGLVEPAASYLVVAYPQGAMVRGNQTSSAPLVYAGHGVTGLNDACVIRAGALVAGSLTTVTTNDATHVTLGDSLTLLDGDLIYQLGTDSGSGGTPAFDGSAYAIYSDTNSINAITSSRVTTNADGEYSYFYGAVDLWELVLTGALTVVDAIPGVLEGIVGPTSSTDNAIVRFDGTSGRVIQNYSSGAPTVGDTGAMTVNSTLAVTGAATLASAGVTAALTVGTTATVTGNLTGSAHLRGGSADVNITGNDAITTADRFHIRLTNVSGTNTITIVAPSSVNGKLLVLECVALTAGTFTMAKSSSCSMSAAWTPNADDTLTLIASGAIWKEIGRSANAQS